MFHTITIITRWKLLCTRKQLVGWFPFSYIFHSCTAPSLALHRKVWSPISPHNPKEIQTYPECFPRKCIIFCLLQISPRKNRTSRNVAKLSQVTTKVWHLLTLGVGYTMHEIDFFFKQPRGQFLCTLWHVTRWKMTIFSIPSQTKKSTQSILFLRTIEHQSSHRCLCISCSSPLP